MSDTRIIGHRKVTDRHPTESKATSWSKLPTGVRPRLGHRPFVLVQTISVQFQFLEGVRVTQQLSPLITRTAR